MSPVSISPAITGRLSTLDELWAEAETLGSLDIETYKEWGAGEGKAYNATLHVRLRGNGVRISRKNRSLQCAIADAISEAREMGAGAQP